MECFGIADLIVLIKATRAICLNDRRSLYFRSCRPQHRISVDNSNQFPEQKNSNNLDIIFQAVAVADLDNLNIDHENPKDWCVVCVCVCQPLKHIYIYICVVKNNGCHISVPKIEVQKAQNFKAQPATYRVCCFLTKKHILTPPGISRFSTFIAFRRTNNRF